MPARDLARIAYCMLRGGRWGDRQVIPKWFVDETAAPTHNVTQPGDALEAQSADLLARLGTARAP